MQWLAGELAADYKVTSWILMARLSQQQGLRRWPQQPRIKTTVVGSYPVPDWLLALPSEQALIDATRVVIHTQEQAGIDLVCDGELSRFDVNHPETNGMIEYFVRPMAGMRTRHHLRRTGRPIARSAAWAFARGRRRWSKARSAPARSICRRLARAPGGSPRGHSSSR